jgi:hypothetical protein
VLHNLGPDAFKKFRRDGYRIKRNVRNAADVVRLAYMDVCRTLRGIRDSPHQARQLHAIAEQFVYSITKQPPRTQLEFDNAHRLACRRCVGVSVEGLVQVHYGQAQKLINMSCKYLLNEASLSGTRTVGGLRFPDAEIEHLFHVPVDNQMLDCLTRHHGFLRPDSRVWSQWDELAYDELQMQVRSRLAPGYVPIEIDYLNWNETCAGCPGILNRA